MNERHAFGRCSCCADLLAARFSRRHVLAGAGGLAAVAALQPSTALAAKGSYEAMVLSCIDPRMQVPVSAYMAGRDLTGKYSHFVIAGASIGVVAEPFKDWQKAFWDNLATSIAIHSIKSVIVINHRDCGAAAIAYGEDKVKPREVETETHRAALAEFRKQVGQRQASLKVETGLMAVDGTIEMIG